MIVIDHEVYATADTLMELPLGHYTAQVCHPGYRVHIPTVEDCTGVPFDQWPGNVGADVTVSVLDNGEVAG